MADAAPTATYKWNSPTGPEVGTSSTFIIQNPTMDSQFGVYVCEASNKVGFARQNVEVFKIGNICNYLFL